jgi:ribosomal protein S27AE
LRHLGKAGHKSEIDAEGIHLVLKYAPLLFEHSALDRLENFLKGKRRILQAASSELAADIEEARARMWRAHAIWDQLERQEKCKLNTLRLAFSGTDEQWTTIIRTWELMGVVASFSTNGIAFLKLATRMDELVVARCPNCGVNARLAKSVLLSAVQCGKCRKSEMFVQISDVPSLEA